MRPAHPSGKRVRDNTRKQYNYDRPPRDKFLTPGLNKDKPVEAIGFLHRFGDDDGTE